MADVPAVAPTPVPEKPANAPTTASAKNKPSSSPMPILEKPVDAPATTLANKKPPSSSNSKKRKGKGPPDPVPTTEALVAKRKGKGPPNPAPAAEVPVAKKPKTGDARTSTAEPPRSRVAVAAVQTLPSASSATFATLRYGLPVPRSTLPLLQDADTDGQMPQQVLLIL
jgi:hypothetical protein